MMFDLSGKAAIVTGAASGIGQGMAIGLAEAGADVLGVDIKPMDETKTQIEALSRRFISVQQNLLEFDKIPGIVDKCVNELGKVDILINCAGMSDTGRTPECLSWSEYEYIININLNTITKLSLETYKQMVKQGTGGKIINISSILAVFASEGSTAYTTSKNGIIGLTKAMGVAGAKHGIWVNAIAPGSIVTNMLTAVYSNNSTLDTDSPEYKKIMDRMARYYLPAGRMGWPQDMKGIAIFLASKESDFITGQVMCVDGGISVNNGFVDFFELE